MALSVASSPHFSRKANGTRSMMLDVIIALSPVIVASIWIFSWYAVVQVGLCVLTSLATESIWQKLSNRPGSVLDGSGAVTGIILGLSLPWSAPWYVPVIGSAVAIILGKMVFGGLGMNLFNPAMVGRAFIMLSFAGALGASAYVYPDAPMAVLTQATPLSAAKSSATLSGFPDIWALFMGNRNGSLGETSALAILIGGIFLCIRRTASWQLPVGVVVGCAVTSGLFQILGLSNLTILQHLLGGSLLFGAFFIATDPVTSPLTPKGKWIFAIGIGITVVFLRSFSSYPAGVMFAVLLMNAVVPLINRWTIPTPVGGPLPSKS
ncbi:MAG: RnfABCDGE type electron transport complex subunit D [Opitutales bacterium]|nr:RnfABCDGE type electron transport complex subunit D [Opitutales bacterium]